MTASVALASLACGGDDQLSRAEVVAEASAACEQATGEAQSYAERNQPPADQTEVAAALDVEARIGEGAVRVLRELRPDEDAEAGFDEFLDAQAEAVEGTADAQAAAAAGDVERLDEANAAVLAATTQAKRAADEYGLEGCPASPVSVFYAGSGPTAEDGGAVASGTWSGEVTEVAASGESNTYTVTMTIAPDPQPGEIAGTIEYPTIPCDGEIRLSQQAGNVYTFDEQILRGVSTCGRGGVITASIDGDTMDWRWEDPAGSGTVVSGELGLEG